MVVIIRLNNHTIEKVNTQKIKIQTILSTIKANMIISLKAITIIIHKTNMINTLQTITTATTHKINKMMMDITIKINHTLNTRIMDTRKVILIVDIIRNRVISNPMGTMTILIIKITTSKTKRILGDKIQTKDIQTRQTKAISLNKIALMIIIIHLVILIRESVIRITTQQLKNKHNRIMFIAIIRTIMMMKFMTIKRRIMRLMRITRMMA